MSDKTNVREIFVFDTSSFLEFKRHYPRETFSGLFEALERLIEGKRIISHQKVYEEMKGGKSAEKEDIMKLLRSHKGKVFRKETQSQHDLLWQHSSKLETLIKVGTKKEQADPYLIVMILALKNGPLFSREYCLVTQESPRKPKNLPALCKHFDIDCVGVLGFFEKAGILFTATGDT